MRYRRNISLGPEDFTASTAESGEGVAYHGPKDMLTMEKRQRAVVKLFGRKVCRRFKRLTVRWEVGEKGEKYNIKAYLLLKDENCVTR